MWELDVQYTSDGVLVVFHDDDLARTTDVALHERFKARRPWPVNLFSFDDLGALDAGSWFIDLDPFGEIGNGLVSESDREDYRGLPIPGLTQVLELAKELGVLLNVEIKDLKGLAGENEIVEDVVARIERADLVDRVIVSSFNAGYVYRVKRANPNLASAWLIEEEEPNPILTLTETDADAFHPGYWVTSADQIRMMRDFGYWVNVWTVNDSLTSQSMISAGVNGVITDFPQRFAAWTA